MVAATNTMVKTALVASLLHLTMPGVSSAALPDSYPHSASPMDGYQFFWKDITGDSIEVALQVETTGWVGLGIADVGGMKGADIVNAAVLSTGEVVVEDRYSFDTAMPFLDECDSHWVIVAGSEVEGVTTIELSRLLDTGDPQDRAILLNGVPTRFIFAVGSSDVFSYHGSTKRVTMFLNLDGSEMLAGIDALHSDTSLQSFQMREAPNLLPARRTVYTDFCVEFTDINEEIYIVGFEPLGIEAFVHHFIVMAGDSCTMGPSGGGEQIWAWAQGNFGYKVPLDTGFQFGGEGRRFISINIHYDNPTSRNDLTAECGVKFFYQTKKPRYELGMIELGDANQPYAGLMVGAPVHVANGEAQWNFYCPKSCFQDNFVQEEVHLVAMAQHMHQVGTRMVTTHSRNGQTLKEYPVDFYDFAFQDFVEVPNGTTIKKGDGFEVSCFYEDQGNTVYGINSENEMCKTYIVYYPKQPNVDVCGMGEFNPWGDKLKDVEDRSLFLVPSNLKSESCITAPDYYDKIVLDTGGIDASRSFGRSPTLCTNPDPDSSSLRLNTAFAFLCSVVSSMLMFVVW